MGTDREEWISKRAYELWEQADRPEGKDEEQWYAASAEWEEEFGPVETSILDDIIPNKSDEHVNEPSDQS